MRLPKLAVDGNCPLCGSQRRLELSQVALNLAQVHEALGEVGQKRIWIGLGQSAPNGDRLLHGSQRRLALPEFALSEAQVVEDLLDCAGVGRRTAASVARRSRTSSEGGPSTPRGRTSRTARRGGAARRGGGPSAPQGFFGCCCGGPEVLA